MLFSMWNINDYNVRVPPREYKQVLLLTYSTKYIIRIGVLFFIDYWHFSLHLKFHFLQEFWVVLMSDKNTVDVYYVNLKYITLNCHNIEIWKSFYFSFVF